MGFCTGFAKNFVGLISIIMLIVSLIAMGLSAYAAATFGDELKELELNNSIFVGAVFGAFLFILSIVGLLGACKEMKCLLFIYLLGSLVLSFGLIVAGGVVLAETGVFDNVAAFENVDQGIEERVLHFELAAFSVCCEVDKANVLCGAQPCAANEALLDSFINFIGTPDGATCDLLKQFQASNGKEFITGNNDDVCTDGKDDFVAQMNQLLDDNIALVGGTLIGTGVIMLLLMICTCCLMFKSRDEKKK